MKELFFISGLPRSGSTLLSDLLSQNDDFYTSPTSGLIDMIKLVKNNWNANEHFKSSFEIDQINEMLSGMPQSFYSNKSENIIFDKSRAWTGAVPLANLLSQGGKAKIIVTVRKVTDIISSFEKMYRKNAHNFTLPQAKSDPAKFNTLAGRCESWVSAAGIIGSCYTLILEAIKTGYLDNFLFVDYDNLCIDPDGELKRIYNFIGKEWSANVHQYKNVLSTHYEYEIARGFPQSLHQIRSEVKPQKSDAIKILGKELFEKYSNSEFWSEYI